MAGKAITMTREEVAEYLGVGIRTLGDLAYKRQGPPFFKIGSIIRYRKADVDSWIENQVRERFPA